MYKQQVHLQLASGGINSTVACESALRSAGTLLSRVRAPLPAPWPEGGPESLRSPCCGLAIYKNSKPSWQAVSAIKNVLTHSAYATYFDISVW
ncbi:hypothetical protein PoB_006338000 [Plakobranchus ocellatus]|uniref:Uncharacterized protein n=1 Tax=Plakobranchus ocellatus TaxID=259542 RepID=A0AAV4CYJ7_9GAST|nr:hypothetical protein PoB_006338000 [Plakobranchus ocellatus]